MLPGLSSSSGGGVLVYAGSVTRFSPRHRRVPDTRTCLTSVHHMPGTGADRVRTGRTGASPGKDSISVKRLPRGARVLHKQNAYQECLKDSSARFVGDGCRSRAWLSQSLDRSPVSPSPCGHKKTGTGRSSLETRIRKSFDNDPGKTCKEERPTRRPSPVGRCSVSTKIPAHGGCCPSRRCVSRCLIRLPARCCGSATSIIAKKLPKII
jgi:hypothetical protein